MYVRLGTRLTGRVYDNISVNRVIMRDSITGRELFKAALNGENWEIVLNFSQEQNGEKIAAEIVAYDSFGNSGDTSIVAITLIVDIREPIIDDIWIQRTPLRRWDLEPYMDLKALESRDPRGERSANANRYQNGSFWIDARISEDETRIDIEKGVTLNIYEWNEPNIPLVSIEKDPATSTFSPRWLIKEEEILTAGDARHPGYRNRYNNGERFYYRVEVVAYDRSDNQSPGLPQNYVEDQGFFVMWKTADSPKGVLDPMVAGTTAEQTVIATRGSTLPVEFFDDDSIAWAFAGLLTEEQWNGYVPVGVGFSIQGADDEAKLECLRTWLRAGEIIYNWKYDKYSESSDQTIKTSERILNQAPSGGLDEKIYYVQTGSSDNDNGEFVLFSLVGDKKLQPHDNENGALDSHSCKAYKVSVVDENAPMIVFDIKSDLNPNGSPEENTFPDLTNGRYFTIKGYTLRAISSDDLDDIKKVTRFRVAWIPYYINNRKPDDLIRDVQVQLKENNPNFSGVLQGVQWWEFTENFGPSLGGGTHEAIGIQHYRKQDFEKQFDVLGASAANTGSGIPLAGSSPQVILRNAESTITGETHFVYNGQLENETKLFVFYAQDNMDHDVYRQIRFLGNKAPPTINVYDITTKVADTALNPPNIDAYIASENPPQTDGTGGTINEAVRAAYRTALKTYQSTGYTAMAAGVAGISAAELENSKTQALQAYPRGTLLKYWITAHEIDDVIGLSIESIRMQDISTGTSLDTGYSPTNNNRVLSYCERLPEVTQRTFLFTASDTLGNIARIQRTVTITNAAVLTEINTVSQSGTYGIGETITLRAVFSNPVYWTGQGNIYPQLIVSRTVNNRREIMQIATTTPINTNTLFLEFPFTVAAGESGRLETMYADLDDLLPGYSTAEKNDVTNNMRNRPIRMSGNNDHGLSTPHNNCAHIYDAERNDNAFTPGNVSGIEWSTAAGSLQASKEILLDGKRPTVSGFSLTGITASGTYYFKDSETISFTLTADEVIETAAVTANGTPRISFQVRPSGGNPTGTYYANWERSVDSGRGMVFSHTVSSANPVTPDGTIENIQLSYTNGRITDVNGNLLEITPTNPLTTHLTSTTIRIDKTAPTVPAPNLNGQAIVDYYQANPILTIPTTAPANEPWGIARIEYSLNNGLSWSRFYPNPVQAAGSTLAGTTLTLNQTLTTGPHMLKTRYVDMAGNNGAESGPQTINVNNNFPALSSIMAVSPNGTYRTNGSLSFNLVFQREVYTTNTANVTITLSNRSTAASVPTGTVTLTATAIAQANASNTVNFLWSITGTFANREMLDGLYISAVNFSGLRDRYGNTGPNTGTASVTAGSGEGATVGTILGCINLSGGKIIVDCLPPSVTGMNPANMVVDGSDRTGNITSSVMAVGATNLTLTFSEPVRAGSGTITIKPHGQFLIPPVLENDNYYLNVTTGVRSPNSFNGATLIKGFYEIYNSALLETTHRQTLTAEWSVTTITDGNARTGQSTGPYMKMTQGLREGSGYTGDYGGTGANGPNPASATGTVTIDGTSRANAYMIPDTSTKWVLDYSYSIDNSANTQYVPIATGNPALANASDTVVPNIRNVLTRAKYRWQEIDVSTTTLSGDGKTVTITLNEPLEKGLQWDVCYPAGTFTDAAGNEAPAVNYTGAGTAAVIVGQGANDSACWFWSGGVQTPVIRVNRKSFDARTQNWSSNALTRRYNVPSDRGVPGGWGIGDFNTVHYRIETETPGARITYGTINGRDLQYQIGSAYLLADDTTTAAWDLTVAPSNAGQGTGTTTATWNVATNTNGTWVSPNLIRRGYNAASSYTITENGTTVTRTIVANTFLFRSYNRDATLANLNAVTLGGANTINSPVSSGTALNFAYYATEARKDYVVAKAQVNHLNNNYGTGTPESSLGYEGVFRSVVALTLSGTVETYTENGTLTSGRLLTAEGSNIKNGMPSIAGFPVRDAQEMGDNRFVKTFYRAGTTNNVNQFYWVSTEIVSQWYFLKWGGNGTHMNLGEVNNYLTAGYGDLTFGRNIN
jgi:hypothetical protein